jgi:hypothetical protein
MGDLETALLITCRYEFYVLNKSITDPNPVYRH